MKEQTVIALRAAGLDPEEVATLVRTALSEDLGEKGDSTTSAIVPVEDVSTAKYVARAAGVVAGLPVVATVIDIHVGDEAKLEYLVDDGDRVQAGDVLATVTGSTRRLLEAERVSLNLLGHLSGIATETASWVEALAGTHTRVRDTRKTLPGLRSMEKYAVRCGGGVNHRFGLYDEVLIKDNHIVAAGGIAAAIDAVRQAYGSDPGMTVQVEVENLEQLDQALSHGASELLLDNMSLETLTEAVRRARQSNSAVSLEASGGLTLETAREVATSGVDFVAVGALTHSSVALDIGLDF